MNAPLPAAAAQAVDASADHKGSVRERVFQELRRVALPDSRFHYDFAEFIADFQGSEAAAQRLMAHPVWQRSQVVFITPDNCLEWLRWQALLQGKRVLITTYSIKRGFWLLDPARIPAERLLYAATLDGMERHAQPLTLAQIRAQLPRLDCMITGTGAINEEGVRFGKGHGFFDAEWGMLYRIGVIDAATPAIALVHDCQVLRETLHPEVFDTVADLRLAVDEACTQLIRSAVPGATLVVIVDPGEDDVVVQASTV